MDNSRFFYAYDMNQSVNSIPWIPPITETVPGHGQLIGHSVNTGGMAGIGASNTISPLSYDIERLKMLMMQNKQMVPALNPIHPMVAGGAPTKGALTNVRQAVPVPIPMPDTPSAPGDPVFTFTSKPKSAKKEFSLTNGLFKKLIEKAPGLPKNKDGNYTRRFLEKLMTDNHMTPVELSQKLTNEGLEGLGGADKVKSLIEEYDNLREKSRSGKEKFKEEKLLITKHESSSSSSSSSSSGLTTDEQFAHVTTSLGSLAPDIFADDFPTTSSLLSAPMAPTEHLSMLMNASPIKNREME